MMKGMPIVAEIVGVSGSGKSTLSAAINERGSDVVAGLTVWGLPFTALAASSFLSVPDVLSFLLARGYFRRDEVKQVIRLNAFRRLLKKRGAEAEGRYSAFLLDEGIVFALAKLRADDIRGSTSSRMLRWEQRALGRWASLVQAVVLLDASDEILIHRIRSRAKNHRMKNRPDDEMNEFIRRYRDAYASVIEEITRRNEIRLLEYCTDQAIPGSIAGEILDMCESLAEVRDAAGVNPITKSKNEQAITLHTASE